MASKSNHFKLYLILILCSLCFVLLSGELIARIFINENTIPPIPEQSTLDPYKANPYMLGMRPYVHFHIPNAKYIQSRSYYAVDYNINSASFRGPEIYTKKKDRKRLIIIGDSIVEGHGCNFDDTFSVLLDNKADKYNWDVLNLGIQGSSPFCYAANINRYLATEPDIALIVLFENDLYDDRGLEKTFFEKPILDNPELLLINNRSGKSFLTLLNKSRLYLLLKRAYNKFCSKRLDTIIKDNKQINIFNKEQNDLNKMSKWLVAPSMFDTQWGMSEKYLDFTLSKFKKNKIPVYVIFMALGSLSPGLDNAYSQHSKNLNTKIEKWAKSKNIPFLSLVPTIQNLYKKLPASDFMIKDDGHPTPKLHAIIADEIWKWVTKSQK